MNKTTDQMRIYQLKTSKEFLDYFKDSNLSQEQLMQVYAEDVAKRFAAECVNNALGNKMEVSNALHSRIESMYKSIIWENEEMSEFKQYRRTQIAEMRPVTEWDIKAYQVDKHLHSMRDTEFKVSISDADRQNGSPKIGDMIARNPKNHNDQWLVAKQYFEDNFEPMQ